MRGNSLLFYTILLLIVYFVEESTFLSLAGGVRGVPLQVNRILEQVHGDLVAGDSASFPKGVRTFVADCDLPSHPSLTDEEFDRVLDSCDHPYEANERWPGTVCVFYDFQGYEYRMCKELLYRPARNHFFDGTSAPTLKVERDIEERTLRLTEP